VTLDYCTLAPAASNTTAGLYKYQNIRFAAVPTGDLRFAAPEWPPVETEVNDGSLVDSDVDCASTEDCLYMSVLIFSFYGSPSFMLWNVSERITSGPVAGLT
jgi:hypothetical protein